MGQAAARQTAKDIMPLGVPAMALASCGSSAPSAASVPTAEESTPTPTKTPGRCFDEISPRDVRAGSSTKTVRYGNNATYTGDSKTIKRHVDFKVPKGTDYANYTPASAHTSTGDNAELGWKS